MTDVPVDLDQYRGMAAQKATELRRLRSEVEAQRADLAARQSELEYQMVAAPSPTWEQAAEKARYLLGLFAATPTAADPRRQQLIENVLADFDRLLGESPVNCFVSTDDQ